MELGQTTVQQVEPAPRPARERRGRLPALLSGRLRTPDIIEDGHDYGIEIGTDDPLGTEALQQRQGQDEEWPHLEKPVS